MAAAQYNIEANNIENVQIIRMSAEDFTQAMQGAVNLGAWKVFL